MAIRRYGSIKAYRALSRVYVPPKKAKSSTCILNIIARPEYVPLEHGAFKIVRALVQHDGLTVLVVLLRHMLFVNLV